MELERTGKTLNKVADVFFNLLSSNTNDEMDAIAAEISPKLSAHSDAISLNKKLFNRVHEIFEQRNELGLNTEQKRLVEETHKGFIRSGVQLDEPSMEKLTIINQELSSLSVQFDQNLLKETNEGFSLIVEDEKQLDGLQQRVGLARALATDPQILLMDEAFSALDPLIRSDMQNQLVELQSKLKKTIVFITHDLDESLKLGDHIGILNGGRLVQVGRPEDIIMNPADDYVKAFVKDVNRSKVLRAKTVMTKIDKFDASTINASSTYKYDEDTFIEDLIPKVLKDRSTIEVIDKTGNTIGYISSDELSVALTKTT